MSQKPCAVQGIKGSCMFVWECIKLDGEHIGMCVDAFMFGSCCVNYNKTSIQQQKNQTSLMYISSSQNNVSEIPPAYQASTSQQKVTR